MMKTSPTVGRINLSSDMTTYIRPQFMDDIEQLESKLKDTKSLALDAYLLGADSKDEIKRVIRQYKQADERLEKLIYRNMLNELLTHEYLQREILLILRDSKINFRIYNKKLSYSWFTKTFRKKYMQKQIQNITTEVYAQYKPQLDNIDAAIASLTKELKGGK